MRHPQDHDEMLAWATLYALGALPPEDTVAFEAHVRDGCVACQLEVNRSTAVVGHLGCAAAPVRPRPQVRDRLLARIQQGITTEAAPDSLNAEPSSSAPMGTVVRAGDGVWQAADMSGVLLKPLFRDQQTGRLTALVLMERGIRYPPHRHTDTEELYLLTGDLIVEGQVLQAGDYCAAIAGTIHGSTSSAGGCTFILVTSEVEKLPDRQDTVGSPSGLVFVRNAEGTWKDGPTAGVAIKRIFSDPARHTMTALIQMRAGARLPRHRHVTAEQFYMLEGDGHVEGHVLHPGDYYQAAAGSVHEVTHTEHGCVFLLIASRAEVLS